MVSCQGRVITIGVGKSGHIARKIAATLASTGTLSFFVHAGEAAHGDLGIIAKDDLILALSNSGNTDELAAILTYAKRHKIPIIAMTADERSTLARHADHCIILPAVREACPHNLAPTTSTTMMLAAGDGIALAVMSLRGFNSEDFREVHPGGNIGRRLLHARDLMDPAPPLLQPDAIMSEVLIEITAKALGCAGVTDEGGRLIGIITDGDLRRHMDGGLLSKPAHEIMTKEPITGTPLMLAAQALQTMNEKKIMNMFILENGKPVGLLHIHHCLRAGL
ncbi:MAG: KpsF/GutQ family sugar-phosphate isomerase [Pseudomonadota bacterium]